MLINSTQEVNIGRPSESTIQFIKSLQGHLPNSDNQLLKRFATNIRATDFNRKCVLHMKGELCASIQQMTRDLTHV